MITIVTKHLKAAVTHSAVKDVRYYLNTVCLRITADSRVFLMATDGHRAFIGRIDAPLWSADPVIGPVDLLIPADSVKAAVKTKDELLRLDALPDGRYMLGNTVFAAVDGEFPDISRVVPDTLSGDAGQFNPVYLDDANQSLITWHGNKKHDNYLLQNNGNSSAVMAGDSAFVVVMPMIARLLLTGSTFKSE